MSDLLCGGKPSDFRRYLESYLHDHEAERFLDYPMIFPKELGDFEDIDIASHSERVQTVELVPSAAIANRAARGNGYDRFTRLTLTIIRRFVRLAIAQTTKNGDMIVGIQLDDPVEYGEAFFMPITFWVKRMLFKGA